MRAEEITNRSVDLHVLCIGEPTVSTARNGHKLVRHAGLVERFVQADAVVVGDNRIGVAMDGQDRRKSLSHVGER